MSTSKRRIAKDPSAECRSLELHRIGIRAFLHRTLGGFSERPAVPSGRYYSDEQKKQIVHLYANRELTVIQIAERMECTPNAIYQRLHKWGVPVRKPHVPESEYTAAQDALIFALRAQDVHYKDIALRLGRTSSAIRSREWKLKKRISRMSFSFEFTCSTIEQARAKLGNVRAAPVQIISFIGDALNGLEICLKGSTRPYFVFVKGHGHLANGTDSEFSSAVLEVKPIYGDG